MNPQDILNMDASKVRGNSNLMRIYISLFEETFGSKLSCAGCAFSKDFNRLKKYYTQGISEPIKRITMSAEKTFKYKSPKGVILTFIKDGKKVRRYDNNLTEEFVIGYLTHGTPEEIERRKSEFSILPDSLTKKEEVIEPTTEEVEVEVKEKKPRKKRTPKSE